VVDLKQECSGAYEISLALAFVPYWFRFAQSLRRYYDSGMKINLVNAGKYFFSLLVPLAGLWYSNKVHDDMFYVYIAIHFVSSTYSYCWDIYMDWGLLRYWGPDKYGLREKTNYPIWFYYFAIVTDLILRFAWVLTIWTFGQPDSVYTKFQVMTCVQILCESIRRAQWSLIRVENE
jgi:xenotropic and polytropic retrovirus receptor 1